MSMKNCPPCPPSLKQIQHYLKTALEHDERDIVVAYWCRFYAVQSALKYDSSSPEAKNLLIFLMNWLEKVKSEQKDNEAISHDIPAQAHLENYALKLFLWADSQDRAAIFNKNVVKAFYTSGMIYDVLDTFGEPTEEVQQNKKYAKWKAAYIHNCLKNGETPHPGPLADESENLDEPSTSRDLPPAPASNTQKPPYWTDTGFQMPTPGGNGSSSTSSVFPPVPPTPAAKPEPSPAPEPPKVYHKEPDSSGTASLSPEQVNQAQKYCKWAASALNYDDVPTAIKNLQKALTLLTTGVDD